MDVIVIGAGPVGSFTAARLAQAGLRTLVLEEHALVGEPVHCTGVIGRQVFERFDLPRECILRDLSGAIIYSPGGHSLSIEMEKPQAYVVDRRAFDRRLSGLALEAGASYLLGVRAQSLERERARVLVTIAADGCARRIDARMCIIAAGSRCRIGADLGLRYPASYAVGAQVEAAVPDAHQVEVYCGRSVAPGSFGWVVPVGDGMARVGLRAFGEVRSRLERFLQHPLLRGRIGELRTPPMGGPIPAEASPKTYAERVLTVGDAAGQVKTTTGGGVGFGLMCAEIAVRVAVEACRRDMFDEAFLRTYQRSWRRAIARELRLGLIARRLAALLRDDDIDTLFRCAQRQALAQRLADCVDFDNHATHLLAVLRTRALLKGALA
jgi:geranylgeranyl reductase family protein